jgi:hypothetical protein
MAGELTEIVIPKEKAVFRMDARGRWHNAHGRFRKKSIIDHFNRSIQRDDAGYFVTQTNGDRIERVYFPYEDTALFVTDVLTGDAVRLILNTGEKLPLSPKALFIRDDNLYMERGDERIKFSERGLLKLADMLEGDDSAYYLRMGDVMHPIRKKATP